MSIRVEIFGQSHAVLTSWVAFFVVSIVFYSCRECRAQEAASISSDEGVTIKAPPGLGAEIMKGLLSEAGKHAVAELDILKGHKDVLTIDDLDAVLSKPTAPLTRTDYVAIINIYFSTAGAPDVENSVLTSLFQAKREAVRSFECDYERWTEGIWVERGMSPYKKARFRLQNSDVMLDYIEGVSPSVISRHYAVHVGLTSREEFEKSIDGLNDGTIMESRDRFECFDSDGLLSVCRLINSKVDLGKSQDAADFASSACAVFPGRVSWRGHDAVVVGSPEYRIYLSPAMNYAIVGTESILGFDDALGKLIPCPEPATCEFDEFHDYGNGLWLPAEITTTMIENEKQVGRIHLVYTGVKINGTIPASEFSVIPDGVHVIDQTKNIAFVKGTGKVVPLTFPSGMRVEELGSSKSLIRYWLVAANLFCVMFFVAVFLIRRRRARLRD